MKKRNQSIVLALFLAFTAFTVSSCSKYEDGPAVSFRSRTERVANTWNVENAKKNGNDVTSLFSDYNETFTKAGDYSYNWSGASGAGKWSFQNEDKEIRLEGTVAQADRVFVIQKLEENTFWYYYMDGTDKYEFHLIAK